MPSGIVIFAFRQSIPFLFLSKQGRTRVTLPYWLMWFSIELRLKLGGLNASSHSSIMAYVSLTIDPRFLTEAWWAQVDSNHRPHAYQACALTT